MRRSLDRLIQVTAAAIGLAITLAACGGNQTNAGSTTSGFGGSAINCPPASQSRAATGTPTLAILGSQGSALTSYDQDLNMVLNSGKETKARVIVNGVSTANHAPDLLSNVVLTADGVNNLARTNDLNCKIVAVKGAIATLKKGKSSATPDVFDALSALADNLESNPSNQPVDVLLLTSLVARGGGIDLSDPKTLANPVQAINTLAAKALIPSCKNWRLYGVSPSQGLNDVQAAQLKRFWMLYAEKCGGMLVAWVGHLSAFPVTTAIRPADTSELHVQRTQKQITATLGADVLFGADSAVLLDAVSPALQQLLSLATKYDSRIVITGYVNPVASMNTDRDRTLSLQRAIAVKAWLVHHNVAAGRIAVVGKGAADAVYPHPKTNAEAAANRRVVTVIDTTKG